ncbi:AVID protein, partial [Pitta sordida]|nr:AVID protein [Pitta sordida]
MVQATLFLLVLSLALGAHGLAVRKCDLVGSWKNDLGSNMTIEAMDEICNFRGIYYTAVANSPNPIRKSPLLGSQQHHKQPTFGFTVNWSFSESTTVFTGQCFVENGKEVLKTMWLLRSYAKDIQNDWNAT